MAYARMLALRLAALLPALVLWGVLASAPTIEAVAAEWPAEAYVLQVDGLACPYCGYGVEKQFAKQEGVKGTKINIEKSVVVVSVTPDTRFSDDQLKRIVHDAGFQLGGIMHRPQD